MSKYYIDPVEDGGGEGDTGNGNPPPKDPKDPPPKTGGIRQEGIGGA